MASLIDRLAQTAYEAHRAALPASLPPWETSLSRTGKLGEQPCPPSPGKSAAPCLSRRPNRQVLDPPTRKQRHTFGTDFTVGREGSLAIDDDFASGQHARFQTVRGLWYVEDLGSTNGTMLNGRHVLSVQLLKKRDKIQIGHTVMTVVSV